MAALALKAKIVPKPPVKAQRIRDPLHNLIEFGTGQFERTLWRVVQTPPFQRLRRIRQLGFSEYVFPGATHTRFAHSIGVFHTARQLMEVIRKLNSEENQKLNHQAEVALAAALVHDVGHGMFSHAFEEIGKKLSLPMARHESVSELLIRDSEISHELKKELGSGFANDVADVIKRDQPGNLYDTVVSSQFDADRLDYVQRDRLMTGVQSSGIDATWLMANLEIGSVPTGADDQAVGTIETLVLGPKAFQAAENYVLSLFQLYPNVYLHKTTRAAEKVFLALMLRLMPLMRDGHGDKTGLPSNHPIRRFADMPDSMPNVLLLDDAVFWGALPMMATAEDAGVAATAKRLWERRLPKCIDIRRWLEQEIPPGPADDRNARIAREKRLALLCARVRAGCEEWADGQNRDVAPILVDQVRRSPYKKYQDSQTPLNQILVRHGETVIDMAEFSAVVASAETYEVCRAYIADGDTEAKRAIENIMRTEFGRRDDGNQEER